MSIKDRRSNQNVRLGCGILVLMLIGGVILSLAALIGWERNAMRYPNAVMVPHQTTYQFKPTYTGITATYRTTDNFEHIRDWYIQRFNMTLLTEDIASGCILLEGNQQRIFIRRYMFVSICITVGQQTIVVNHSASIN